MTAKQRSQYVQLHPSGAGENQAGAAISSDSGIPWVAQHCISQSPAATCCLCSCSSVSDLSACLYFPHVVSSFFLDSHARYPFSCSWWWRFGRCQGEERCWRATVSAFLCSHSWSPTHKHCLWGGGASPQTEDFFLSGIPVLGGCWSPLPLEELKGHLAEVTGMSPPGQPDGAGWFQRPRRLLLPTRLWGRGWWGNQGWSVYTRAPLPVGENSLQSPNCSLRILVLLIFKLD